MIKITLAAVALMAMVGTAFAQNIEGGEFTTATPGKTVVGIVTMCLNADGVAIPATTGAACAVNVTINPVRENSTPRSGSIAVGGAWQQIAPANPNRRRLVVQNPCSSVGQGIAATENIFVGLGTEPTSTRGTFELVPCGSYESTDETVGTGPVYVLGATTGHLFTAVEW